MQERAHRASGDSAKAPPAPDSHAGDPGCRRPPPPPHTKSQASVRASCMSCLTYASRPSGRGRTACQIAVQDPACMQKRHARRDVTRDAEHGRQARAAGGVPSVFQKLARLDGSLRGRKREPRRTLTGAAAGAAARRSAGGRLSPGHTATRWQARMRCASEQPAPAHAPASAAYPAPCAQRRAG